MHALGTHDNMIVIDGANILKNFKNPSGI